MTALAGLLLVVGVVCFWGSWRYLVYRLEQRRDDPWTHAPHSFRSTHPVGSFWHTAYRLRRTHRLDSDGGRPDDQLGPSERGFWGDR